MTIKYFQKGSKEWLTARKKYITGTEIASLLGLNPNKSANQVIKNKLINEKSFDNIHMRAGRILEPGVLIALNELGIPAEAAHSDDNIVVMGIEENSKLSASLDGKAIINDEKYIVECKTTSSEKMDSWLEEVPINYFLQVQVQLLVTELKTAIVACMESSKPFGIIVWVVKEVPEIQEILKETSLKAWKSIKNTDVKYEINQEHKKFIQESYKNYCTMIKSMLL